MTATPFDKHGLLGGAEGFRSDAEAVGFAAAALEISEHRLFQIAHREWFGAAVDGEALDRLFRDYLVGGAVPFWVRDLARKIVVSYREGSLRPAALGVERAPSSARERRIGWALMAAIAFLIAAYGWFLVVLSDAIERYWRP